MDTSSTLLPQDPCSCCRVWISSPWSLQCSCSLETPSLNPLFSPSLHSLTLLPSSWHPSLQTLYVYWSASCLSSPTGSGTPCLLTAARLVPAAVSQQILRKCAEQLQHHMYRCSCTHSHPILEERPHQTSLCWTGLHPQLESRVTQSPGPSSTSRQGGGLVSQAASSRVAAPLLFSEPRLTGKGLGVGLNP